MQPIYNEYRELQIVSERCINCNKCQPECEFLARYGKPKEIADAFNSGSIHQGMAFECNLCQLCATVCPIELNPAKMFMELRQKALENGTGTQKEHAGILAYEKRGTSKRYTWYSLPENCDTIFFPGCTLPGTRPATTVKLFNYLKKQIPSLGIVLDCCTKPSHDLGRTSYFEAMFQEMRRFFIDNGIKNIFVACPNCFKVFKQYGDGLSVQTIYEYLSKNGIPQKHTTNVTMTVHDPCSLRFESTVHDAVRSLITKQGIKIEEMPHTREKTLCCGEGGSANCISPDISGNWYMLRKQEAGDKRVITYCAGCSNLLGKYMPTTHILDHLFEPEVTLNGGIKVSKPPITYINRLKLKRHFKKNMKSPITREREFVAEEKDKHGGKLIKIALLLLIVSGIIAIRLTGAHHYLNQEALRQIVADYGTLAPVIYMLLYTLAPSLFLPGLPITIVGGILFGPFWGVIYTIIGATLGACVAFLVSRYIARDWIASKLKSPKWQSLDQGVERNGWKVVAFTRLIPIFPFNLLNYAFGLTKIQFRHYAVTTFICMLPGCIAYIVFSSSLLEVLKGNISLEFIAGLVLIVLVSLIPMFYKRYKDKKGISDPL